MVEVCKAWSRDLRRSARQRRGSVRGRDARLRTPPHRSGRAGLSGSAAIADFCPHRTHRAALPQWALQDGPEADRSSVPSLMDDRLGEWEDGQEAVVDRPAEVAFLASLPEGLAPELDDVVLERPE